MKIKHFILLNFLIFSVKLAFAQTYCTPPIVTHNAYIEDIYIGELGGKKGLLNPDIIKKH